MSKQLSSVQRIALIPFSLSIFIVYFLVLGFIVCCAAICWVDVYTPVFFSSANCTVVRQEERLTTKQERILLVTAQYSTLSSAAVSDYENNNITTLSRNNLNEDLIELRKGVEAESQLQQDQFYTCKTTDHHYFQECSQKYSENSTFACVYFNAQVKIFHASNCFMAKEDADSQLVTASMLTVGVLIIGFMVISIITCFFVIYILIQELAFQWPLGKGILQDMCCSEYKSENKYPPMGGIARVPRLYRGLLLRSSVSPEEQVFWAGRPSCKNVGCLRSSCGWICCISVGMMNLTLLVAVPCCIVIFKWYSLPMMYMAGAIVGFNLLLLSREFSYVYVITSHRICRLETIFLTSQAILWNNFATVSEIDIAVNKKRDTGAVVFGEYVYRSGGASSTASTGNDRFLSVFFSVKNAEAVKNLIVGQLKYWNNTTCVVNCRETPLKKQ